MPRLPFKLPYFSVYNLLLLLLGKPGAGNITNAGYTLLKSEIARGHFFIILVKCLLISSKCAVFLCTLLHSWQATRELAVDGRYTHTAITR